MKKLIFATLAIGVALTGCKTATTTPEATETKRVEVAGFTQIVANTVADIDVVYHTDSTTIVVYDAPKDLIDNIVVNSSKGQLNVSDYWDNEPPKRRDFEVHLTIYTPNKLESCTLNGVGDITLSKGTLADQFVATLTGVGDIKAHDIDIKRIKISLAGVGDAELRGRCDNAELTASGVGDIEAKGLIARSITAQLSGVGDIECHTTDSIIASCDGMGDIEYYGNPTYTNIVGKNIKKH